MRVSWCAASGMPHMGHLYCPRQAEARCKKPWHLSHYTILGLLFTKGLDYYDPNMRNLRGAASDSVTIIPLAIILTRIGVMPVVPLTSS